MMGHSGLIPEADIIFSLTLNLMFFIQITFFESIHVQKINKKNLTCFTQSLKWDPLNHAEKDTQQPTGNSPFTTS